jgi:hypothetical protein
MTVEIDPSKSLKTLVPRPLMAVFPVPSEHTTMRLAMTNRTNFRVAHANALASSCVNRKSVRAGAAGRNDELQPVRSDV